MPCTFKEKLLYIGQTVSCSGLDDLISNFNSDELSRCVKFGSCTGVYCVNVIRQLRHIVEIFNFTLLPCTWPTPALVVQLLGQPDPIHNNTRKVVYRQEIITNTSIPISSGGIVLSTYSVSVNINISTGIIGIEVCHNDLRMYKNVQSIWYIPLLTLFSKLL